MNYANKDTKEKKGKKRHKEKPLNPTVSLPEGWGRGLAAPATQQSLTEETPTTIPTDFEEQAPLPDSGTLAGSMKTPDGCSVTWDEFRSVLIEKTDDVLLNMMAQRILSRYVEDWNLTYQARQEDFSRQQEIVSEDTASAPVSALAMLQDYESSDGEDQTDSTAARSAEEHPTHQIGQEGLERTEKQPPPASYEVAIQAPSSSSPGRPTPVSSDNLGSGAPDLAIPSSPSANLVLPLLANHPAHDVESTTPPLTPDMAESTTPPLTPGMAAEIKTTGYVNSGSKHANNPASELRVARTAAEDRRGEAPRDDVSGHRSSSGRSSGGSESGDSENSSRGRQAKRSKRGGTGWKRSTSREKGAGLVHGEKKKKKHRHRSREEDRDDARRHCRRSRSRSRSRTDGGGSQLPPSRRGSLRVGHDDHRQKEKHAADEGGRERSRHHHRHHHKRRHHSKHRKSRRDEDLGGERKGGYAGGGGSSSRREQSRSPSRSRDRRRKKRSRSRSK